MVNPLRGEYNIELGGRTIALRGNFDNVARVEKATGKSVEALATNASLVNIPLTDTAKIIWGLAHNKGSSPYTLETIGQWIYEGGNDDKLKLFAIGISLMMGNDPDSLGEEVSEENPAPAAEKKETVRAKSKSVSTKQ